MKNQLERERGDIKCLNNNNLSVQALNIKKQVVDSKFYTNRIRKLIECI